MVGLQIRLGLALGLALCTVGLVSALGQQRPVIDAERAFAAGDADLDGRLSFEEYREQIRNGPMQKKAALKPALKTNPAMAESLFRRFDTDSDSYLTLAEYRKLFAVRAGGMLGKNAASKKVLAGRPVTIAPGAQEPAISSQQSKFFETKIRPVLVNQCQKCHAVGAEKVRGGLLVDSREGLRRGGDTGPAVVPGKPEESLLIQAIRHQDEDLKMPPKVKLPDAVIADFESWVKMGAPDPRNGTKRAAAHSSVDLGKAREFWAFKAPKDMKAPAVKDATWPKSEIDRFLLAALEKRGLKPVGDADRATLIRRASFDLTGLPPTPEDVGKFLKDPSPDAFATVVDHLLASPRFGERWGRHWLDVARFAESSGKVNLAYPQAWRYRDWVIAAFNSDKPYDLFVKEQIAGDLLPAKGDRDRADHQIATGFLAVGSKTHNTQNRQQFLLDLSDEQIDAVSQAFLGLTVACARCHDHKFDPIPQRDYYALVGVFESTQTCYGTLPGLIQSATPSPHIELPPAAKLPSAVPKLTPERRASIESQLAELKKTRDGLTPDERFTPKGFRTNAQIAMQRYKLGSYLPDGTPRTVAMGVRERDEPVNSPLYIRGELDQPGEIVPRGFLQVLSGSKGPAFSHGSGRLELADRLAARDNPLIARVMVNRIWLHLFGRGLVPTPENFGAAGQPPSHPELLDHIAVSFMDQKWSIKQVIRRMILSRAYQLSSAYDSHNDEVDPDNSLVWRMSKKRLEAEAIRDAVLAVSGKLDLVPPIGSIVARAGEGPAGPGRVGFQEQSEFHRSVYLPVVRDQLPESLTLFDFADPSLVTSERASTSGPSQALYLMNSPFIAREAHEAADRLRALDGDENQKIERAYVTYFARTPTASERERARAFLNEFAGKTNKGDSAREAWAALCQALYAAAEFRYID